MLNCGFKGLRPFLYLLGPSMDSNVFAIWDIPPSFLVDGQDELELHLARGDPILFSFVLATYLFGMFVYVPVGSSEPLP